MYSVQKRSFAAHRIIMAKYYNALPKVCRHGAFFGILLLTYESQNPPSLNLFISLNEKDAEQNVTFKCIALSQALVHPGVLFN